MGDAALRLDDDVTMLPLASIRRDGGTQPRAAIDPTTVEEYALALDDLPPVDVMHDGTDHWLTDGFHRLAAYASKGRELIPARVSQGTREDAVWRACAANATHGLRRTTADKHRAIDTALRLRPELSDRAIAKHVGVDDHTVARRRRLLSSTAEIPHSTRRVGEDGVEREMPRVKQRNIWGGEDDVDDLDDDGEGDELEAPAPVLVLPEPEPEPESPRGEVHRVAAREALLSSESVEWYTPEDIIEAAREVMGGIDLDPASCLEANEVVRAKRIYAREDRGLEQPWSGRVWLNPPYGWVRADDPNERWEPGDGARVSAIETWTSRLLADFRAGAVKQACTLVTSKTGEGWFQALWDFPICFVAGRVAFRTTGGEVATQNVGSSVVVYLGEDVQRFERLFGAFGRIVIPSGSTSFAVRPKHRNLCSTCGQPCSTGKSCPTCKQLEREDRRWHRPALEMARAELARGRVPNPRTIAVKVRRSWFADVVPLLVRHKVGTEQQRKQWQREAYLARKG